MTDHKLMEECDLLKGNINRIMVIDDIKEIREMYNWACKRLDSIYIERVNRLLDEAEDRMYNRKVKIEVDEDE